MYFCSVRLSKQKKKKRTILFTVDYIKTVLYSKLKGHLLNNQVIEVEDDNRLNNKHEKYRINL